MGLSERKTSKWFRSCPHQGPKGSVVLIRTFVKDCSKRRSLALGIVSQTPEFSEVYIDVRDESKCVLLLRNFSKYRLRYGAPLNLSFHLNRSAAYLKFFVNSATWNEPVSAGGST